MKGIARLLVELRASATAAAPTELRIFSKGKNESTQGTFIFDDKAAETVMAAIAERGVEIPLDYNHGSTDPMGMLNPELSGKAAGWCNLEVRDGELWAVNIRWTENALKAITAREWRYISPTFSASKDKRVVQILAIALTNTPALHNLDPLVAAAARMKELSMDGWVPMCLGRSITSSSLVCQACACKVLCASLCYGSSIPPDPAGGADAPKFQMAAREAGAAWEQSVADKATTALRKELSMKTVLTALKLSDSASEAEALSALTALQAQIVSLSADRERATGEVAKLVAKVSEMETAAAQVELSAVIEQGKRDRKITPAMESALSVLPLTQLKAVIAALPPAVDAKPVVAPKDGEGTPVVVALSDAEKKNLRLVKVSEEAYLKHKAEMIKNGQITA